MVLGENCILEFGLSITDQGACAREVGRGRYRGGIGRDNARKDARQRREE